MGEDREGQRERFVVECVTMKGHGREWLGKMKEDL